MVLDTSVCIDLLRESSRGEEGPARQKLAFLGETPIYVALFSVCELQTGVRLARHPDDELRRLTGFLQRVTVLYPDESFSTLYGEAASHLLSSGTPIPVMDLMIGIVAKARSLPLLTRDTKHFDRIPGLVVEGY